MQWLKDQFAKSNIISGALALAIWGAIIYLAVYGRDVPEILYYGGATVIAFFFGSKTGQIEGERRALIQRTDERTDQNG